jgi:hypothetical protein
LKISLKGFHFVIKFFVLIFFTAFLILVLISVMVGLKVDNFINLHCCKD